MNTIWWQQIQTNQRRPRQFEVALSADIQLIIIGTLPLIMPKVLWLTGTYISTIAGIVAAFIAAVVSQLFRTPKEYIHHLNFRRFSNKNLLYLYSPSFRSIAICISGFFYSIAIILTIVGLIVTSSHLGEFRALMLNYHEDCATKALVDNIQFALQCCGGQNYKDWFQTDWGPYENNDRKKQTHQIHKTSTSTESITCRNDAVPFSCCARSASTACIHQNLFQLGVSTINYCGCDKKLHSVAVAYLWFEIFMYSITLGLEIIILVLLRTHPDSKKKNKEKPGKFGEFINTNFPKSKISIKGKRSSKSRSSKSKSSLKSETPSSTSSKQP